MSTTRIELTTTVLLNKPYPIKGSAEAAPRFLMCPPTLYDVDYVINPMDGR